MESKHLPEIKQFRLIQSHEIKTYLYLDFYS